MDRFDVAARLRQVREAVEDAAAEVTSEDHAVTVVAGPGGAVRSVRLSSRAFQLTGAELGEVVVRTIRQANAQVDAEIRATLSGSTPVPPSPSLSELRTQLRQERR
ncbi:YbaB/EbfC family nucleoid-associated protein [Catenuloplanes atrovinosus]|uniref:DNA-binding protein YbaB n=1 Tax=Catenuloplanes atrovinosus TaxID=137266 RepID=A0AAE4C8E9_9ACTN|nr:YbaB/EbfC family nucleoid-associated protein [Catenuloplanes atrovinosus]MDR7275456.1 DNA-binding protein YbaB [Catenuloplanes atrovinosus]